MAIACSPALFAHASGIRDPLAIVEVQPRLGETTIADLLLTFEGGSRILVEVQVEPAATTGALPGDEPAMTSWGIQPSLVLLGLSDACAGFVGANYVAAGG